MTGVNLKHAEAKERARLVKVDSYDIDLDLTAGSDIFVSTTVIKFSGLQPGASTFIDAVGRSVVSATLNGEALDVSDFDGETIKLPSLAANNELRLVIEGIYSKSGEGLHRFVDPADGEVYLYTQHETADARRTFPCFDQPDLKATFAISTLTPAHWEVISNNAAEKVTDLGESKRWDFKRTPVISTYLTAIVAGAYHRVDDVYVGQKTVPLGLFCRKSLAEHMDSEELFKLTKQGFAFYEKEFGLAYPFDKYDQLAVAEFNAGAMENVGCVTFGEDYFVFRSKVTEKNYNWRANVILHEMAHMWFGDLVTMTWWEDLWLNESFAEWASYVALEKATRFTNSWTVFNAERKNWAYRQDQLSSTHPIVVEMEDMEAVRNNFDGISYAKGASVLQQLVSHVGQDKFLEGLRAYFAKHAWGNTTLNDLLVELEAVSGRNLKPWVSTWLQTAGVNTLRPELAIEDGVYTSVKVKQEAPLVPVGSTELRPHRLAVGLYDLKDGALIRRKSAEIDLSGASTLVTELAGEKVADLVLLNDRDLTYAKIRFDEKSITTLKEHLGDLQDPLSRALCWSAVWDMLRDGELSASDYVPLVINALAGEQDAAVVQMTLLQLDSAVELFAANHNRTKLRAEEAIGIEALLDGTELGSDLQLIFARAFASTATSTDQIAKTRSMLDGEMAGLVVDADMRWHLLNCLIERGVATSDELDAELEKDNTANGQRYAAFARAAFPDQEVKEVAFEAAITSGLSNHIQLATIRGFQRATQRELLENYVDRYFEIVLNVWQKESYEMASNVAMMLYPTYIISQETLTKTEKWLETIGKEAPSGLRRTLAENRDAMARALNAQAKDAQ
ncbi:MAG: aminopeptidase N [Actinobacteria bacterium]|nr:aminopeptidase N [Actinomycetota bacterium]